jgi:hypothetical protein
VSENADHQQVSSKRTTTSGKTEDNYREREKKKKKKKKKKEERKKKEEERYSWGVVETTRCMYRNQASNNTSLPQKRCLGDGKQFFELDERRECTPDVGHLVFE